MNTPNNNNNNNNSNKGKREWRNHGPANTGSMLFL